MAVFDNIGILLVSALSLAFVAVIGFIVLKMGLNIFKMIMSTVYATRGIENMEIVQNDSKYRITEEEDNEFQIIGQFMKTEIEKSSYASYLYRKFKVEMLITEFISLRDLLDTKMDILIERGNIFIEKRIKKNQYTNSIKSKIKKHNYTKYAYIQLFKR